MELVADLLNAYQNTGRNMSLKIHFFTFPLGLLPSEPGRSERRSHQGIFDMEKKYAGKSS